MSRNKPLTAAHYSAKRGNALRFIPICIAFFWVFVQGISHPVFSQHQYLISDLVPIDSQSGDVVYLGVGRVKGVSAIDLYTRAQSYFNTTIRPGSGEHLSHPSKRTVRERGILTLTVLTSGMVQPQAYRVTMEVKVTDGRYRYEFSRFAAYPDSVRGNIPIRDVYRPMKRTTVIDEQTARTLKSWDRSVRAYIRGFIQYMNTMSVDR